MEKRTLTWIREFLSNRQQEVMVDGAVSDPALVVIIEVNFC